VCAIESFFLAMTVFPDVQRKAQEEIDRVLGPGQLPKVSDRQRLPFVSAVVKEVLRWHPVAPMGIPHMSSEDDTWGEYFIPKGSLIMPNIWCDRPKRSHRVDTDQSRAFTHDPEVYKDPMEFRPERFLGEEPEEDPTSYVFGFGRRVCPGRFLADNTLYLSIAQSLAVFRIEGTEVKADANFQPGVISHPVPWKHQITPRSADHEALILSVEQEHPWTLSNAPSLETLA
jgi:cytochrome P450